MSISRKYFGELGAICQIRQSFLPYTIGFSMITQLSGTYVYLAKSHWMMAL